MQYLLDWFWELSALRSGGFSAPNPIPPTEVEAWSRLTGIRLEPWEARMILKVDRYFISAFTKEEQKHKFMIDEDQRDEVLAQRTQVELNPNIFDSLF